VTLQTRLNLQKRWILLLLAVVQGAVVLAALALRHSATAL
jgi:hypothetical protein